MTTTTTTSQFSTWRKVCKCFKRKKCVLHRQQQHQCGTKWCTSQSMIDPTEQQPPALRSDVIALPLWRLILVGFSRSVARLSVVNRLRQQSTPQWKEKKQNCFALIALEINVEQCVEQMSTGSQWADPDEVDDDDDLTNRLMPIKRKQSRLLDLPLHFRRSYWFKRLAKRCSYQRNTEQIRRKRSETTKNKLDHKWS